MKSLTLIFSCIIAFAITTCEYAWAQEQLASAEMNQASSDEIEKPEDVGKRLRLQFLSDTLNTADITPNETYPNVYGVAMEWWVNDIVITVTSTHEGHADLYSTSTFGVIGGSDYESVQFEAKRFVQMAQSVAKEAKIVTDFPYPNSDSIRFYLLTYAGTRMIDAPIEMIQRNEGSLFPMAVQGQAVVTALRQVAEGTTPSPQDRAREFLPSYVNGLLTLMGEGVMQTFHINAQDTLPDLLELPGLSDEQREWITSLALPVENMSTPDFIDFVKSNTSLIGPTLSKRNAVLETVLFQDKGETIIPCVFDLTFERSDRSLSIVLAPQTDPRSIALKKEAEQ